MGCESHVYGLCLLLWDRVAAGTMRGRVRFQDLAGGNLEYVAQVHGWQAERIVFVFVCLFLL